VSTAAPTFRNPLYARPLADPFVLKFNGGYYAYGTPVHGEALPVLRSSDLVRWEHVGEVVGRPRTGLAHWAPEVAYDNGRFLLYHSTGGHDGEGHQLRVTTAMSPTGPFVDEAVVLDPDDPFTIDAHPFRDDDGSWYLFYSRDFLEGERVGTGIVVDRLVDMTALAGDRTTVVRPHAEWHLYERGRRWYDRVWDWYTVEGPFVRKHDGRYWCFYSGGAWKAENYGMASAVADHPMGPYRPVAPADTADVLRTVPGEVIGPGHGCVAVAPDNLAEYLVYHAWDVGHSGRFMHADRLTWTDGRPQSPGPLTELQPCPPEPLFRDLFDPSAPSAPRAGAWDLRGAWTSKDGVLTHPGGEAWARAVANVKVPASYLLEVNLAMPSGAHTGRYGVVVSYQDDDNHAAVLLDPGRGLLQWHAVAHGEVHAGAPLGPLPAGFSAAAYHQLVVRQGPDEATVTLDGIFLGAARIPALPGRVGVWTAHAAVDVAGVAVSALP
jgi:arabinan endo-1,5-alpha-L-arabinosidase